VAWRLHGSLPRGLAPVITGADFVTADRELERSSLGPRWMMDRRIATCIEETLLEAERGWGLCRLSAWVVMPNHVHVLLFPYEELSKVMLVIKSASARRANRLLERPGQRFWQDESFDRWVRDGHERSRIIRYIEANPVAARLVAAPEHWRWSSAWVGHAHGPSAP
jgi:REP element-mobilizing transposase RayT